jgi:hypothetical protein
MARMLDSRAADGLVSRAAATLLQKSEKERSGVLSTVHRHTDFLDSPRLRNVLSSSTFDLADLKRKRMSVFLCLPTDRLPEYHRWIRLMIGSTLCVMMRTRGWPEHKVLMLLDEFQNLGRLGPVERDIALAGGFGVRLWLLVQDIPRLRDAYPKTWETFFTNNHEHRRAPGVRRLERQDHVRLPLLAHRRDDDLRREREPVPRCEPREVVEQPARHRPDRRGEGAPAAHRRRSAPDGPERRAPLLEGH